MSKPPEPVNSFVAESETNHQVHRLTALQASLCGMGTVWHGNWTPNISPLKQPKCLEILHSPLCSSSLGPVLHWILHTAPSADPSWSLHFSNECGATTCGPMPVLVSALHVI